MTPEQVQQLLNLAGTIGTHLWEVLVRQAVAEGVEHAIWTVLFVAGALGAAKLFRFAVRLPETDQEAEISKGVLLIIIVIVCVACVLFAALNLSFAVKLLLNPEFRALELARTLLTGK